MLVIFVMACVVTFSSLPAAAQKPEPKTLSGLLKELSMELRQRDVHIEDNRRVADSLRVLLGRNPAPPRSFELYNDLIATFSLLNADSVITYCDRAVGLARLIGDSIAVQRFLLQRDAWCPAMGVVKEAIDDLERIAAVGAYPPNRIEYLRTCVRVYHAVSQFYPSSVHGERYSFLAKLYADSLASELPADSPLGQISRGLVYSLDGNVTMAKSSYMAALDNPLSEFYDRSRAAAMLGELILRQGQYEEGTYYMALAALINARRGNLTFWALEVLGNSLHKRGEFSQAYNYLNIALENAVISGNRVEAMRIAEAMPELSNAFQRQYLFRIRWLMVATICLLITLVVIVLFLFHERRNNQRLNHMRRELRVSDLMKEAAISNFLGLCIIYMERLEDFTRMARRKIAAGQTDSLLDQLKSGKIADNRNKVVNEVFDTAFTRMYPDFVTAVNALLLPDKQIPTPSPSVLNTELRVLAFMRLGVEDTQQVARILGLSLNTVYTYRNKLRTRAINRESFDADVMRIGEIE